CFFIFSSRRRHTRSKRDWSSDVCSSDLIDIGLGAEIDGGFTLCRELRARSAALPIIFLTARDSDFDIVAGLRLGADDYLTKDVRSEERRVGKECRTREWPAHRERNQ